MARCPESDSSFGMDTIPIHKTAFLNDQVLENEASGPMFLSSQLQSLVSVNTLNSMGVLGFADFLGEKLTTKTMCLERTWLSPAIFEKAPFSLPSAR